MNTEIHEITYVKMYRRKRFHQIHQIRNARRSVIVMGLSGLSWKQFLPTRIFLQHFLQITPATVRTIPCVLLLKLDDDDDASQQHRSIFHSSLF
jgi:hypothetical protein